VCKFHVFLILVLLNKNRNYVVYTFFLQYIENGSLGFGIILLIYKEKSLLRNLDLSNCYAKKKPLKSGFRV